MEVIIRPEEAKDQAAVESLTREAFWNVYQPGCEEHLIVHQLRESPAFIPDLNLVAESEGTIIGHIIYSKGDIRTATGSLSAISFGPVSVRPQNQKQGIGTRLIEESLKKARELGFELVLITGSPQYYSRFGFVPAASFGIHLAGIAPEDPTPFFMAKELKAGASLEKKGTYHFCEAFGTSAEDLAAFDRQFPEREKIIQAGQLSSGERPPEEPYVTKDERLV